MEWRDCSVQSCVRSRSPVYQYQIRVRAARGGGWGEVHADHPVRLNLPSLPSDTRPAASLRGPASITRNWYALAPC